MFYTRFCAFDTEGNHFLGSPFDNTTVEHVDVEFRQKCRVSLRLKLHYTHINGLKFAVQRLETLNDQKKRMVLIFTRIV